MVLTKFLKIGKKVNDSVIKIDNSWIIQNIEEKIKITFTDNSLTKLPNGQYLIDDILQIKNDIINVEIKYEFLNITTSNIIMQAAYFKLDPICILDMPITDKISKTFSFDFNTTNSYLPDKRETRRMLLGTNMVSDGDHIVITATDAVRLINYAAICDVTPGEFNIIVPILCTQILAKIDKNFTITTDQKFIKFESENCIIETINIIEKYPDISRIIPANSPDFLITVKRQTLLDSLKLLGKSKLELNAIVLNITRNLSTLNNGNECCFVIESLDNFEHNGFSIKINQKYVLDLVKSSTSKFLIFGFYGKKLIRITHDYEALSLIVPLKD